MPEASSIFGEEYKVRKIGEYGKVSLKRIENEYFIDRTIVKDKAYELKEMFKKCITEMKQLNSQ